jgi:hypothetical protein
MSLLRTANSWMTEPELVTVKVTGPASENSGPAA